VTAMNLAATAARPSIEIPPLHSSAEYVSWGRYPRVQHRAIYKVNWTDQVQSILTNSASAECLAYGLGRSYGDSCLNEGRSLIDCSRLDRLLAFDRHTGLLTCEAGTSLAEILRIAVPAGWFLPVTPGTKSVTVGGAIANDVHGKNHHRSGSFGLHVSRLLLCRSDRGILECGPHQNADLFRATVGGLGLTGVILCAEIALKRITSDRIDVEAIPFESAAEFLALSADSDSNFEYTVAWIDCLSYKSLRGIVSRGNHAKPSHLAREYRPRPGVPLPFPRFLLNGSTARLFNSAYFHWKAAHKSLASVPFDPFFYPLDSFRHWNLAYGKSGFLQYQCVIPESSSQAVEEVIGQIAKQGSGPFLAVLKRFGGLASPGMLSFPRPGITLALDFPMRGEGTLRDLRFLDQIVQQCRGAVYPAKDARMDPETFETSFPHWREFRSYIDPVMSSSFWRRVTGN
jgi:FAD/FMN-containing dehydrogenase